MIDNVSSAATGGVSSGGLVMRRTPFGEIAMPEQQGEGDQYNFGLIFGAASDARLSDAPAMTDAATTGKSSTISLASALASANAAASVATPQAAVTQASTTAATDTAAAPAATTDTASTTATKPGIQSLVSAIMDGSFQPTYVSDPTKLTEINPVGTDQMPNFYYASDATANQMAQLLGGKVIQQQPFSTASGWTEPLANFIQLSNGMTVNAGQLAYYARCGVQGPAQLTADLTQAINQGSAWNSFYKNGGPQPSFAMGYVGPPITGMDYPSSMIGADGNVINPAMPNIAT